MRIRALSGGFALPTVVITTVIMFAVLVAAVSVVSSTRASLDTQFYEGLASDAAESGATYAEMCLKTNNYVSVWTTNVLRPDTTCTGASPASTCTAAACWLVNTSQYRTTYQVEPSQDIGNGVQTVRITGTVQLLRAGTTTVWQTYSKTNNIRVGAQISGLQLVMGYIQFTGAFFGVIGRDGAMRTVGYNGFGMLGNGTSTNTLTPTKYQAPTTFPIVAGYSNFLSQGYQLFAVDSQGDLYGAGANDLGQLGNGTFTHPVRIPTKATLPAGVKARAVAPLGATTYVIGDDNNVYASGACTLGLLGNNYTVSGCSNRSTFVRVALPTPNVNDPNTLPVFAGSGTPADNIVTDRRTVYIRMQGGRVYGWGDNYNGQLATGGTGNSSVPVKIGTFGDVGQSKATQLAFDGETVYILDDKGSVYTSGSGPFGSMAGAPAQVLQQGSGKCLNNAGNSVSASQSKIYDCIGATSQLITFTADKTITTSPNSSTTLCLDNYAGGTGNNNPVYWYPCDGSNRQRWTYLDNGGIVNEQSGMCLNNSGNSQANDAPLGIWTCDSSYSDQRWTLLPSWSLAKVPIPSSAGAVQQIATDQWSVLFRTASGEVWGAGGNDRGQLCNGVVGRGTSNNLTKAALPAGRLATYVYTMKSDFQGSDYANTYFILDDNSVYGCGANTFGQLGTGSTATSVGTPVKMNLPANVAASVVQTGFGTTVVFTKTGTVYTVGNNGNGQLGDGTTTNRSTPIFAKYINDQAAVSY